MKKSKMNVIRKSMTIVIVFIAFTMSLESFAQTFRIKTGLNLSKMLDKDYDTRYSDDYTMKPGFHVGATAEFPLNGIFHIETGMFFSTKGYRFIKEIENINSIATDKEILNLFYVDIPLTAKVSFDLDNVKIYCVFGPYVGIGISGKFHLIVNSGEIKTDDKTNVKWGSSGDDNFKRFDYGLIVGAGIEKRSVQIGLTYGLGLANISAYTTDGAETKNRVLGISIGYKFGGK